MNWESQFKFNMQFEMHKHIIEIFNCMLKARFAKNYEAWLECIDSLYSRVSGRLSKKFRGAYLLKLFEIKKKINDDEPRMKNKYREINSYSMWKSIREFEEELNTEMDRIGLIFTRFDHTPRDLKLRMQYGLSVPDGVKEGMDDDEVGE